MRALLTAWLLASLLLALALGRLIARAENLDAEQDSPQREPVHH